MTKEHAKMTEDENTDVRTQYHGLGTKMTARKTKMAKEHAKMTERTC